MITKSFHKRMHLTPDDKGIVKIKKGKIHSLNFKNVDGTSCRESYNKDFEIKRESGWVQFNCIIKFEYNTGCYNLTKELSANIKVYPWEYLSIKYFQKKLWINQCDFQQKVFLSVSSALIGAIASYIICKLCS